MSFGTNLEAEFFDRNLELFETVDGVRAALMLLELRTWSAKARTDGRIPPIALRTVLSHDDPKAAMALLVERGLATDNDAGGWSIAWDPEQKTADQRDKGLESGRQKAAHGRGDHSMCPDTWRCSKAVTGDGHKSDQAGDGHSDRKEGRKEGLNQRRASDFPGFAVGPRRGLVRRLAKNR